MDELTLLRRLDADTPAPSREAVTSAFDALTGRMAAAESHVVPRRPRMRRLRRTVLATAGVAALVAGLVLTDTVGVAGLRPGASAEAAELLDRAATTAIQTVDPTLAPGQYRQIVHTSVHETDGNGFLYSIQEDRTTWIPADVGAMWTEVRYPYRWAGQAWGPGAEEAAEKDDAAMRAQRPQVLRGRAGAFFGSADPRSTPAGVNSLPRDPRVLLNHIYRVTAGAGNSADGEALVFIADTLNTGVANAQTRAVLYRAAALIPGVTVTARSATLDGVEGVAIGRVETKTGIRQDLIIDPATGDLIGERDVATRHIDVFPGGTTLSWSSAATTVVDAVPAEYRG